MSALRIAVRGIGLLGPGLPSWAGAQAVLRGDEAHVATARRAAAAGAAAGGRAPPRRADHPPGDGGRRRGRRAGRRRPVAARRRCSRPRAAKASTATCCARRSPAPTASCRRHASPTRSTTRLPATGTSPSPAARRRPASAPSTAASRRGLVEAATQVVTTGAPVLLVVCDVPYPEPLHTLRPLACAMGVALLLAPADAADAIADLAHRAASTPSAPASSPGARARASTRSHAGAGRRRPAAAGTPGARQRQRRPRDRLAAGREAARGARPAREGGLSAARLRLHPFPLHPPSPCNLRHSPARHRRPHPAQRRDVPARRAGALGPRRDRLPCHQPPRRRQSAAQCQRPAGADARSSTRRRRWRCTARWSARKPAAPPTPGYLASARGVRLHRLRLDDLAGDLRIEATRGAGDAQPDPLRVRRAATPASPSPTGARRSC